MARSRGMPTGSKFYDLLGAAQQVRVMSYENTPKVKNLRAAGEMPNFIMSTYVSCKGITD